MFNIFFRSTEPHERPSAVARLLGRLGPSWQFSPFMRLAQIAAFACFLVLYLWSAWPFAGNTPIGPDTLARKEFLPIESFLMLDPLVSIGAAVAGKVWVGALWCTLGVFLFCVVAPRGFCAYVCPLGTVMDFFDWAVGARIKRFRLAPSRQRGWWADLRFCILIVVLIAAAGGVTLTGFVAALPVLTRAMTFLANPLQIILLRGAYHVPPVHAGHVASVLLFAAILLTALLKPRFWCSYLCPTGAMVSIFSFFRVSHRRVGPACSACGKCAAICRFDAVKADFTTDATKCAFCQVCAGACPANAITFSHRWGADDVRLSSEVIVERRGISRRSFVWASVFGGASLACLRVPFLPGLTKARRVVRPPGAMPEPDFLRLCVRCGECLRVCPDSVLQAASVGDQGVVGLWTPRAVFTWAGCDSNCNFCGQVCPTGAIRALPIEEKRCAALGVAVVRKDACFPHAGLGECDICYKECEYAGYKAISYVRVHARGGTGEAAQEEGYLAPEVDPVKCVGCGRCENRCHLTYVQGASRMERAAIFVQTAPVRVKAGDREIALGGEMRLAPPQGYQDEMARRRKEQGKTKRIIQVEW